jgi:hypothetical protein
MPADHSRALEIDGRDQPLLDARAIVLGAPGRDAMPPIPASQPPAPAVVWEGTVPGDGTGPQATYYVRLYADGTAHCQCPGFYFRGVLRRDATFCCKHVRRARARMGEQA